MRLSWVLLVSLFIVLSGLLACGGGVKLVLIGEEDGDKEFVTDEGTKIVISLDTDRPSGYHWVLDEFRDDLLILETEKLEPGVDGAAGKQVFNFTAKLSPVGGSFTPVNFSYRDSSDQTVAPTKKLHFVVVVRNPLGLGPNVRR